ncbi:hypothetical protein BTR14_03220 [Rhizobium rhizosphaerae]|uniref:Uncharacterized protein n=1 Tax=Xaviernesmea rhizosphaerae TaxID=1672749 RepID=A0ABX3PHL5_9HYPH|nr:hypothetical protein [Xaviernesmea rhizosphaerae]OQP87593.1 hypothetical protein BTR14_03220 [Xaviernesmea rhizosphaerae]
MSNAAYPTPTGLDLALTEFRAATARWMLTAERNGDLDEDGPTYDAAQAACMALVKYQCQTDADVQRKIEILQKEPLIRETAQAGRDERGGVFDAFLNSLQVKANADASGAAVAALYRQYMGNIRPSEIEPDDVRLARGIRLAAAFNAASTLKPTSMQDLAMLLVIRTERNLLMIDDELFDAIKSIADQSADMHEAHTPTIASLFDEWAEITRRSMSEQDLDKAYAIGKQIQAIRPVTIEDLAKKFIADTSGGGEAGGFQPSAELISEFVSLAGYGHEAQPLPEAVKALEGEE